VKKSKENKTDSLKSKSKEEQQKELNTYLINYIAKDRKRINYNLLHTLHTPTPKRSLDYKNP